MAFQYKVRSVRKHISFQTFKEALELMVANVISKVAKAKETTSACGSFVSKSIMRSTSSSLPREDLYVVDVPVINFASGLGPSFGKLPREIRDEIFSDLIVSGHPQFMSVSRVMNAEGKTLIDKKGVFRMKFDFDTFKFKHEITFGKRYLPEANIVDKLQNLSIQIRLRDNMSASAVQRYAREFSCLLKFKDSSLRRGNCTIVFDVSPYYASSLLRTIAHSLEGFTNFDTVVMRVDFDLDAIRWVPKDKRGAMVVWARDHCFAVMRADFKTHLGIGNTGSDSDGLRVIFHPRKAQRTNAVGEM